MDKFLLIEFYNKSLDVINEENVISPSDYVVGDNIRIYWPSVNVPATSKSKTKEYTVSLLEISSDKERLENMLEEFLEEANVKVEETGRVKREIKLSRKRDDEEETQSDFISKKKKKHVKIRRDAFNAKSIFQQLGMNSENDVEHIKEENNHLCMVIEELKSKVELLEEELRISRDLKQYMKAAKKLASYDSTVMLTERKSESESAPICRKTEYETPEDLDIPLHPHLLWSRNSRNVVELVENSDIYIDRVSKAVLPVHSRSATSLARSLMEIFFTQESLLRCSVKGGLAKGIGKPLEQREGLYPPAVKAITDYVESLREEKKWIIAAQYKDLIRAMGTKISELRFQNKPQC